MEYLTPLEMKTLGVIGRMTSPRALRERVRKYQRELRKTKPALAELERDIERLIAYAIKQTSRLGPLRDEQRTKERRRRMLLRWILTATARIDVLEQGD